MTRRVVLTGVCAALLVGAALACLAVGVDTAPSTGGLLVDPVPLTRLDGGWVALAVVCATAAVLCGLDAAARWRSPTAGRMEE